MSDKKKPQSPPPKPTPKPPERPIPPKSPSVPNRKIDESHPLPDAIEPDKPWPR